METVPAKTILARVKKSAGWFAPDYNMNLYRGCSHGCIYCDSRSECYRIEHFETIRKKEDALRILRDELGRKVQTGVVMSGAMSDPYNPFEKTEQLTRHSLELLNAYQFGVAVATKSALIARDIDVFTDIKEHSPILLKMTITAADDDLCKKIEPYVSPTSERFRAIEALSKAGLYTGVLMMPMLPFICDNEQNVLKLVHQAKESGARFVYPYFGVTLRDRQREFFYSKLDQLFPSISEKYKARYTNRYDCSSPKAAKLYEICKDACVREGLLYKMQDIIADYRKGYGRNTQLSLFA